MVSLIAINPSRISSHISEKTSLQRLRYTTPNLFPSHLLHFKALLTSFPHVSRSWERSRIESPKNNFTQTKLEMRAKLSHQCTGRKNFFGWITTRAVPKERIWPKLDCNMKSTIFSLSETARILRNSMIKQLLDKSASSHDRFTLIDSIMWDAHAINKTTSIVDTLVDTSINWSSEKFPNLFCVYGSWLSRSPELMFAKISFGTLCKVKLRLMHDDKLSHYLIRVAA